MFDMDSFGSLNRKYGLATGDRVILDASSVFRSVFAPTDILVRFGGDEFVFLLVGRGSESAQTVCDALCDAIRHLRLPEYPDLRLSCSLGFASWPDHAATIEDLKAAADRALYLAKERGRDQCRGAGDPELAEGQKVAGEGAAGKEGEADKMKIEDGVKHEMRSIAEKNRTIRNIIAILEERDDFLLVGHQNPDEDCLGAMVAFGLIAGKFGKRSTIATCAPIPDNLRYLLNICRFNSIRVLENCSDSPDGFNTVVAMDTPKPAMLDLPESLSAMMTDPAVLRIEFDHHLEADSSFCGNPGYRLVSDASSTCELVAILAFKIQGDPGLMERLQLEDLFSRNLVLAILTGIIGDSHMGKFLKTPRERWFYRMFSTRFEEMLFEKTHSGGGNYGSKEELFAAISKLSSDEDECFRLFMQDTRSSPHIAWVALPAEKSAELHRRFGHDTLLAVAKTAADILAERSGYISLVSYHDGPSPTDLLQCRMRRSQGFTGLDLRELLTKLAIENGGGHPGAIGFRFPRDQIPDVPAKAAEIVAGVEAMFP
jgi:diguanylate cyclase (GGDEF)-like protein